MQRYVSGDTSSPAAAWGIATTPAEIKDGVGKYHRFMLSTDNASAVFSWETESTDYASEELPIEILKSVKFEATGIEEKIVKAKNTRGHNVSEFLDSMADLTAMGVTDQDKYGTWVVYSPNGDEAGVAYAFPATVQITTETANAGEKRGHEFSLLQSGSVVKVNVTETQVGETDKELTFTASAAGE